MIARLTGRLLESHPDRVVLDVAGVGYLVHVPLTTYYAIAAVSSGAPVTLLVHTHVREDALQLFGFTTRAEQAAFEDLLAVSGVGPRMALAVVSGIGATELRECVARADASRLQKIPGVGKKTAERILLELQHRWSGPGARGSARRRGTDGGPPGPPVTDEATAIREDALSALLNLGYGHDAARRAVERVVAEEMGAVPMPDLGRLLRAALARLSR